MPYLLIGPSDLVNDKLRDHFDKIQEIISNSTKKKTYNAIAKVSESRPPGTWYNKELRNKAIKEIIISNTGANGITRAGVFPSHKKIIKAGYSGLLDWLKKNCKDMQTVAVENNTLYFNRARSSQSKIRPPTTEEFLNVLRFHKKRLGIENITRADLDNLFGRTAVRYFIGKNKPIESMEKMKEYL